MIVDREYEQTPLQNVAVCTSAEQCFKSKQFAQPPTDTHVVSPEYSFVYTKSLSLSICLVVWVSAFEK